MNENYQSYFDMSIAYLAVGEVAANNENMTAEYQNAVAYQLYHALELFVKYAILRSNGTCPKTHDLACLFKEYDGLYPDVGFRIEHPFDFSSYDSCEYNVNEQETFESHQEQFKPKLMDQHLRYPPDNRTGGYSYKIDREYFSIVKEQLLKTYTKIIQRNLQLRRQFVVVRLQVCD